ncbi:hypothetical protein OIU84_019326 [Salix udensis]|uniref:Uncharacterized protein n=1 Tax=Salix udensis TaxID=889485 RepID=A0AAD6PJA3_9ROSI|nr:hypothetical protein OIU84_019326 [Salix udensis]
MVECHAEALLRHGKGYRKGEGQRQLSLQAPNGPLIMVQASQVQRRSDSRQHLLWLKRLPLLWKTSDHFVIIHNDCSVKVAQ